jgi:hypothetical protein
MILSWRKLSHNFIHLGRHVKDIGKKTGICVTFRHKEPKQAVTSLIQRVSGTIIEYFCLS